MNKLSFLVVVANSVFSRATVCRILYCCWSHSPAPRSAVLVQGNARRGMLFCWLHKRRLVEKCQGFDQRNEKPTAKNLKPKPKKTTTQFFGSLLSYGGMLWSSDFVFQIRLKPWW
jgi:hypothetical protein